LTNKELFYFAGQCLTLDEVPEFRKIIVQKFERDKIQVEEFIKICDQNFILPATYVKFRTHDLLTLLPESVQVLLEDIYDLNKKRNTRILQQIVELNSQLNKINVEPIYLKGTAHLLDGLYGDVGERMIGDIDFLVQEIDFVKAINRLKEIGYKNHPSLFDDAINGMHYPPLFRDKDPVMIEVHRTPVDYRYAKQFSGIHLFKHKKRIQERENCYVSDPRQQLIHNFIHSQLSDLGYIFKKSDLRDLYDLYLLTLKKSPNIKPFQVEEKNKFDGYLNFAGQLFNIPEQFSGFTNKNSKIHCFLCDLSLKHPNLNRQYCIVIKFFRLVKFTYFDKFRNSLYQDKYRKYISRRITTRVWYKRHWRGLKDYFKT